MMKIMEYQKQNFGLVVHALSTQRVFPCGLLVYTGVNAQILAFYGHLNSDYHYHSLYWFQLPQLFKIVFLARWQGRIQHL